MNSATDHAAEGYPERNESNRAEGRSLEASDTVFDFEDPQLVHASLPPLLDAQAGRIARVLMAIPRRAAVFREGPLRRTLEALPHRASLDVLVAPEALEKVSGWIDETGPGAMACLIPARSGLGFPIWVQDIGLARSDGSFGLLGDSVAAGLAETARTLADGAELRISATGLRIHGGDVIACGNRLLIGANSVIETGLSADALGDALDPGRRPLVLGTSAALPVEQTRPTDTPERGWTETLYARAEEDCHQPMPRLDLFVTPAGHDAKGRSRFLVGCPRRGAEALGHPLWAHALTDAFDEIAACLIKDGAEVIRNPMPLVWKDDAARKRRTWFHLPTNNVLLEDLGEAGRTVLMPCFHDQAWPELAEIDSMNAAIWAWLGYSVIRIPEMLPLAQGFGGPRRIVQVLART